MTTVQNKVQFVLWFVKFNSVTLVQYDYQHVFSHENSILRCDKQLKDIGSVLHKNCSSRSTMKLLKTYKIFTSSKKCL